MKYRWFGFILWLIVVFPTPAQTLSTKNKKAIALYTEADNYRVRRQYDNAIQLLKEAIEKDRKFEEAYFRLAIIFKATENLVAATQILEEGIAFTQTNARNNAFLYELIQIQLRMGSYNKASEYANMYLLQEKSDQKKMAQVKVWKSQAEYALANDKELQGYKISALSDTVNAFPMQYFPVITADQSQLIFTARFGTGRSENEDLVISSRNANGSWTRPKSLSDNINTIRREGASTISADGRHLIFTICGERGCDLYESRKSGDTWSIPKSLGAAINSPSWDAQPSLSADGRELYFVSDRPGGLGGYDIWYSHLEDNGWSKASNLGPSINTPFDEISPYIHVNNQTLYVVSNGYPGYGGYDIYMVEKNERSWNKPVNMGKPLNDFNDQYSFIVTNDGTQAYYSREESKNRSKLYKIQLPSDLITNYKGNVLKGLVRHAKTNQPLKASIELFNIHRNEKISVVESDSISGEYLMVLPGGADYALYVAKPGFLFKSLHFNYSQNLSSQSKPLQMDISLSPVEKNASVILNNLFFDVDQYALKEQSITELREIVKFLQANESVRIEISGHTDDTGSEAYNQQLSLKRAASVADYLKGEGIAASRLIQKGYGSQRPIQPNNSEDNRQLNRRIEFRVL